MRAECDAWTTDRLETGTSCHLVLFNTVRPTSRYKERKTSPTGTYDKYRKLRLIGIKA